MNPKELTRLRKEKRFEDEMIRTRERFFQDTLLNRHEDYIGEMIYQGAGDWIRQNKLLHPELLLRLAESKAHTIVEQIGQDAQSSGIILGSEKIRGYKKAVYQGYLDYLFDYKQKDFIRYCMSQIKRLEKEMSSNQ